MPFTHVVYFEFRPDTTPQQLQAVAEGLLALRGAVPVILDLRFGRNTTRRAAPFTHGLVVTLASAADLPVYDAHPAHVRVSTELIGPVRQSVAALDFENDEGSSSALSAAGPFVHLVWFLWKPEAAPAQVAAARAALVGLRARVPQIVDLALGANLTQRTPHTYGLLVTLASAADLPLYDASAAHQEVLATAVRPVLASVLALDFDSMSPAATPHYTLYLGTRNYSSWSLRPWLLMRKMQGLTFAEVDVDVLGKGPNQALKTASVSPSGLVPALHVGASTDGSAPLVVYESLAIAEYLNEAHPAAGVWPVGRADRALARSLCSEMATGFNALRSEMSMNIKFVKLRFPLPYSDALAANLSRVEEIFAAAKGPWLFGTFCAADAMFAPVCYRLRTYGVELASPVARAYVEHVLADADCRAWEAIALKEEGAGRAIAHYDAYCMLIT